MRTLGLNALIREALAAWSSDELSRILRLAGGIPVGAPVLSPTQAYALRPSVPPALHSGNGPRRTTMESSPSGEARLGSETPPSAGSSGDLLGHRRPGSPGLDNFEREDRRASSGTSTPSLGAESPGRIRRRRSSSAANLTRANSYSAWAVDEQAVPFTPLKRARNTSAGLGGRGDLYNAVLTEP